MIWIALIALLAWNNPSHAVPVRVLSGEHANFTRLVFLHPSPVSWQLSSQNGGYSLTGEPASLEYNLNGVFDRIPRTRLSTLTLDPESQALQLVLACDCHALIIPDRAGILIVDIRDGPPPLANVPHSTLPARVLPGLRPQKRPQPESPVRAPPTVPLLSGRQVTNEFQQGILKTLTEGIVEGSLLPGRTLPPPTRAEPFHSAPIVLPLPSETSEQIRLHTDHSGAGGDPPGSGLHCADSGKLNLTEWSSARSPAQGISESRIGLLGEFDRPNAGRITAAAKLHIYYGLGAEARALLGLAETESTVNTFLSDLNLWLALTHIIDGENDGGFFRGMQPCNGPAALWGLLSDPEMPVPADTNRPALLRAFSELPSPLRQALGPALANRFLKNGDTPTAMALRTSFARLDPSENPQTIFLDARLAKSESSQSLAQERLKEVSRTQAGLAPSALAHIAELQMANGSPPDPALLAGLEAMLPDHRNSPTNEELIHSLAKARLLSGQHKLAWQSIPPENRLLNTELWRLLWQHGSDTALVETAIAAQSSLPEYLPPTIRHGIGNRLAKLGFSESARLWLTSQGTIDNAEAMATADLAADDARSALHHITGYSGQRVASQRAVAFERLADYEMAADSWFEAGDPERAARSRYLAGLAPAPASKANAPLKTIGEDLTEARPEHPADTLSGVRERLSQATQSRDLIQKWLTQPETRP